MYTSLNVLFVLTSSCFYISKYSFANVIMWKNAIYFSVIGRGEGVSDLSLTSAFPPPPQEITAEGRKWKRVSQAGYDWNQSAQWQQHPHEARRQQSVRRLSPRHQKNIRIMRPNPRETTTLELEEWEMISVYNDAPLKGVCKYKKRIILTTRSKSKERKGLPFRHLTW